MTINPQASFVCIGNEILSGKTRDSNIQSLASWLVKIGVQLVEVRVVADVEKSIINAVNQLRTSCDYVFTSGGIGPTHDDITALSIANAFGVDLEINEQALDELTNHYNKPKSINDSRRKMAYIPVGAELIKNRISGAVGFRLDNVFVLAGVPSIFQVMLEELNDIIAGGDVWHSASVEVYCGESHIASELGNIQDRYSVVEIGSYPKYTEEKKFHTEIVFRSQQQDVSKAAIKEIVAVLNNKSIAYKELQ